MAGSSSACVPMTSCGWVGVAVATEVPLSTAVGVELPSAETPGVLSTTEAGVVLLTAVGDAEVLAAGVPSGASSNCDVPESKPITFGVGVADAARFLTGVPVGRAVAVGSAVAVDATVAVGSSVGEAVAVAMIVAVAVAVAVGVCVGVSVGVAVEVAVGVGVGVTTTGNAISMLPCAVPLPACTRATSSIGSTRVT